MFIAFVAVAHALTTTLTRCRCSRGKSLKYIRYHAYRPCEGLWDPRLERSLSMRLHEYDPT